LMLRASQRSLRASPVCLRAPSFLSLLLLLFSATSPTEFYTLSLHDALPIYHARGERAALGLLAFGVGALQLRHLLALGAVELAGDRKSTRLNSSHQINSYAVFCLKKKNRRAHDVEVRRLSRAHHHSPPHQAP